MRPWSERLYRTLGLKASQYNSAIPDAAPAPSTAVYLEVVLNDSIWAADTAATRHLWAVPSYTYHRTGTGELEVHRTGGGPPVQVYAPMGWLRLGYTRATQEEATLHRVDSELPG